MNLSEEVEDCKNKNACMTEGTLLTCFDQCDLIVYIYVDTEKVLFIDIFWAVGQEDPRI